MEISRVALFIAVLAAFRTAAPASQLASEPAAAVVASEQTRIERIANASQAVVSVFSSNMDGGGSGVLISPDGLALTNFHVVGSEAVALRCGLPDGKLYDAVVVGIDPTGDVALIKLLGRGDFPAATIGDSDAVRVGQWVFALGNPLLLANDFQPTATYGIVSGTHRYQEPAGSLIEYADCLQIDASINPGNSGGPLFDAEGKLIGINGRASFEKRGRVNVGAAYAIAINQINRFLPALSAGRLVDHATLGAVCRSDREGQVIVSEVLPDSDVFRRGLRAGDVLVELADRPVSSVNQFKNILGGLPAQGLTTVVTKRDGNLRRSTVRLQSVHRSGELEQLLRAWGVEAGSPVESVQVEPKPLPPAVAAVYERRAGFVNFHFNRQQLQRVYDRIGEHTSSARRWTLRGKLGDGSRAELVLDPHSGEAHLPSGNVVVPWTDDLSQCSQPIGSGGMLVALYLWQRSFLDGEAAFALQEYDGTSPPLSALLAGAELDAEQTEDVVRVAERGVEARLYVEPSGQVEAIECWLSQDDDPCVVLFGDFRQVGPLRLPHRIEIQYRDVVFGQFDVAEYDFEEASQP